ncbi:DNA-binding protein [Candidatus Woesearchaeota archaeon]|nr:DNA-binding protein [Candidatus Woesearchaeota archaeon]
MNIKELTPRMGNVELVAEIADIGEVREFNKFGKSGRVATARLKDDTGEIELSLWNEQIDQFGKGDTIKVANGYVKEYQGEMQLTTGMRGSIELVKKGEKQEKPAAAENSEQTEVQKAAQKLALEEERIDED